MEMSIEQKRAIALANARLRAQSMPEETEVESPGALARVGRGISDLTQGIKQLGLMASDAFTGKNEADEYTKQVGEEIRLYEKGRGKDAGFDWMRLAGNVLPVVAVPAAAGKTLAMRVGTGAVAGGVQGGLMFTPEGDSKAAQVATGAVVGAAMPAVAQQAAKAYRSAVNKGGNAISKAVASGMDDASVAERLVVTLTEKGVDINELTEQAQKTLLNEAREQLKVGALNSDALARIAKAQMLDPRLQLTRGQATRVPQDWQIEGDLRAIRGVGDDLKNRFIQQGRILTEKASGIRAGLQAPVDDAFNAGELAIKTMKEADATKKGAVDAAYSVARDHLGRAAPMDAKAFSDAANLALDEKMLGSYLPPETRNILNGISSGKIPFNVNTAVQIDSTLSAAQRAAGNGTPQALAIGQVRNALNNAPIADNVGESAKKAFDAARGVAKSRFSEIESTPALKAAVVDDAAPDKFVRKFVQNADVRDIRSLMKTLTTGSPEQIKRGTQAANSLRAATLTEIFDGSGGAIKDGVLSGDRLEKALKQIGRERLNAIFTPDQVKQLELLKGVSIDLTRPPPMSDINYSRTSSALANLLNSIGKIPGLGVASRVAQAETERVQKKVAADALKGGAAAAAPREFMDASQQNALARRMAPYLVAPANALAYQGNQ